MALPIADTSRTQDLLFTSKLYNNKNTLAKRLFPIHKGFSGHVHCSQPATFSQRNT